MSGTTQASEQAGNRAPSRAAWLLLVFVLVNSFAVNLALPRLPWQPQFMTTLTYSSSFVNHIAHSDSWKAMRTALFYTDEPRKKPLYSAVYFDNNVRFQYPPSSLLVLEALRAIGGNEAILDPTLNEISWWAIVILALLMVRIFYLTRRRFSGDTPTNTGDEWVYGCAVIIVTLTFYPVVRGYYLGQIQVWIDLLLAAVVWAWLEERRALSGALLAGICVIKPTLAIVVIWGALRRQWDFIVGFAVPMSIVAVVALAAYGMANHLDYLNVLSYISRQGEVFHPNQSMNGLLHRLFQNGDSLNWEKDVLVTYHPWVHGGTVVSSLALVAIGVFTVRAQTASSGALELAIVILCSTLAAPTVWTHHYGVTLPLFAMALPAALAAGRTAGDPRRLLVVLVVAFLLVSNNYRVLNRLAETPLNFLQSYVYFGGLLLLGLLWVLRSRLPGQRELSRTGLRATASHHAQAGLPRGSGPGTSAPID
ncbi:MAG: glycosyltransferase family 87 protein [Myxococcota bacterium]|jgi:hypothetical protein|nr:glycosyltransferase family 87 protein [Myxococcota bacterium]